MESEGGKYQVREEPTREESFIVARFFTRRVISIEAVARTFKLLWRTKKGFEVRDMGNHRVLSAFTSDFLGLLTRFYEKLFTSSNPHSMD